ncbi:MAG: glycoside hydrolase family 5 protein [Myxococcales bacterium]|nr:glycoside hydrolase family 5 protein [Myxococcales bacterium]
MNVMTNVQRLAVAQRPAVNKNFEPSFELRNVYCYLVENICIVLSLVLFIPNQAKAEATASENQQGISGDFWWSQPYPKPFDASRLRHQPSFISVKGKDFVDQAGKPIVFQGVSIADPDRLESLGHWNRELFGVVASWGANVVRLPVHPVAYRKRGKKAYFKLLDQAVHWANELSLYLIIDWHSMGNLETEMFQHPMYETTLTETFAFWRSIAFRYKGISTVAFYELFNEPTRSNGTLGQIDWKTWKKMMEELISIIYAHDDKVIPLVAGFNWAYELEEVARDPIEQEGIGYVSHPYPQKAERPYDPNWDKAFGYVAEKYPLIITEMGYMKADEPGAHRPAIDDGSYGPLVTDYLAKKGASWVAWCFDPEWSPTLIKDWNFTPTMSGAHFRKIMLQRDKADPQP